MNAKKCDRCGKFYSVEVSRTGRASLIVDAPTDRQALFFTGDLCSECVESLKRWIKPICEGEKNEN